jgi:DNA-binding NarL/FixJ family response regulator
VETIRVIAIEDHPLMRMMIAETLSGQPDIALVGTAEHGSQLFQLARQTSPHVVVLDLRMRDKPFNPISAVRELLQELTLNVLVLSEYDSELYVRQLIAAGVRGYLLKSDVNTVNLAEAVRRVHRGELVYSPAVQEKLDARDLPLELSNREAEVLHLAAQGYSNAGIAEYLGLSVRRVRNVLTGLYAKFCVQEDDEKNCRVALVVQARELGLIDDHWAPEADPRPDRDISPSPDSPSMGTM